MRVKALLDKVKPETFVENYLQAHGIDKPNLYLNPDKSCLDTPSDYPNMEQGVELLKQAVDEGWKIGLLVD